MQANYYSVFHSKVSVTLNWYASRLAGFQKTHGFADGRSQDAFYSADGTTGGCRDRRTGQGRRGHRNVCRLVHSISARASGEDDHWDQPAQHRLPLSCMVRVPNHRLFAWSARAVLPCAGRRPHRNRRLLNFTHSAKFQSRLPTKPLKKFAQNGWHLRRRLSDSFLSSLSK
jgi:hypothetical protein